MLDHSFEERSSRVIILLSQFRVVTAPFHHVGFADFWLADQLNSLVVVLMDLEYMICFYSFELDWERNNGLLTSQGKDFRRIKCNFKTTASI